jgi:hypothetical protein
VNPLKPKNHQFLKIGGHWPGVGGSCL